MQKHLLLVVPHPDDETFGMGGTVALHAQQGIPVTFLCGTLGEMGRRHGSPLFANRETLPAVRARELRAACDILGIRDLRPLGLRDKTLEFEDPEHLADLIEPALRELKPHKVLTYYPRHGIHPDHDAMSHALAIAVRRLPTADRPEIWGLAWGENVEKLNQLVGEPNVVDISPVVDVKWAALKAHASQSSAMTAKTEAKLAEDPAYREEWEKTRRTERFWTYKIED